MNFIVSIPEDIDEVGVVVMLSHNSMVSTLYEMFNKRGCEGEQPVQLGRPPWYPEIMNKLSTIHAAGKACRELHFEYNDIPRRVEVYSLRTRSTGNLLCYAVELVGTKKSELKAYRVSEMKHLKVSEFSFEPRFPVEFK